MKKIWKYPINIEDSAVVEMPVGAEVLTVIAQGDELVLYALVHATEGLRVTNRRVRVYGTGYPLAEDEGAQNYVGTVVTHNGVFVWHVFVDEEDIDTRSWPAEFATEASERDLVRVS